MAAIWVGLVYIFHLYGFQILGYRLFRFHGSGVGWRLPDINIENFFLSLSFSLQLEEFESKGGFCRIVEIKSRSAHLKEGVGGGMQQPSYFLKSHCMHPTKIPRKRFFQGLKS